jgi:four helix bundle protein
MTPEEMRDRTKAFAIRIVRVFQSLPKTSEAQVLGKQLLRCGTSVAANYRAVCRARSRPEFIAKLGIVLEEADESVFWMDLLIETGIVKTSKLEKLRTEAQELTSIFGAARHTSRFGK